VLELVGQHASVQVAELLPEVVAWNREFLGAFNGSLLNDPRVKIIVDDVFKIIRRAPAGSYDAILLDVDNGPTSFVHKKNSRLYDPRGFSIIARALKPGGRVAFWSANPEPGFLQSLARAGFKAEAIPAKAHERAKRAAHVIYLAKYAPAPAAPRAAVAQDVPQRKRRSS
jgi:spermidine synthase